jgi:hypothetical protein
MPHYLFEAPPITDAQRDQAIRLGARRFPELALEHRYTQHDGAGQDLWVCRAPSQDRICLWAAAVGLPVRGLRRVETLDLHTHGSGGRSER